MVMIIGAGVAYAANSSSHTSAPQPSRSTTTGTSGAQEEKEEELAGEEDDAEEPGDVDHGPGRYRRLEPSVMARGSLGRGVCRYGWLRAGGRDSALSPGFCSVGPSFFSERSM